MIKRVALATMLRDYESLWNIITIPRHESDLVVFSRDLSTGNNEITLHYITHVNVMKLNLRLTQGFLGGGGKRKEEFHNLFSSQNISTVVKSRWI